MIEYTSATTAIVRSILYEFFLDSGEGGLPEHALLLEDFKDQSNLDIFCSLLDANPNTAYLDYLNQRS